LSILISGEEPLARKIGTIEARYPGAVKIEDIPERQLVKIAFEGNEFWTLRNSAAKFRAPKPTARLNTKTVDSEDIEEIKELEIGKPEPILEAGVDDGNTDEEVDSEFDSEFDREAVAAD
jgi:hypothetical protein